MTEKYLSIILGLAVIGILGVLAYNKLPYPAHSAPSATSTPQATSSAPSIAFVDDDPDNSGIAYAVASGAISILSVAGWRRAPMARSSPHLGSAGARGISLNETFSGTAGTHLEDHEAHWVRNTNTSGPYIDLNGDNTASAVGETHYWWNSTQSSDQNVQMDFKVHITRLRKAFLPQDESLPPLST